MEQKQTQERPRSAWLTYQAVEAIVAVVIFLVGVVMMMDGHRIGIGWASDGPKAGYFPFRTGAILCISSVVVFLRALFGKHRNHELFVSWDRFKMVLCRADTYCSLCIGHPIHRHLCRLRRVHRRFHAGDGKFSWPKVILISVIISVMLFWMFEIQFMVPLPKGPLESLFGY